MKTSILFNFQDKPYGGANQFLKALRRELNKTNNYEENLQQSDVILANANPGNLLGALKHLSIIKNQNPEKVIIIRLDGPISLIRDHSDHIDQQLAKFIHLFADGIIFQSHWSAKANKKLLNMAAPYETVIHNAPDNDIFFPSTNNHDLRGKIKLIATSWSHNYHKGFETYQYLDNNLDFSRYQMTFVGNTPIQFKNIKTLEPVKSVELADILRQQHIYITASQNDPCSNSLIEAISCGLPVVALHSGGHPELVKEGGEIFENENDLISKIELLAQNISIYQKNLPEYSIENVASQYIQFSQKIMNERDEKNYTPKNITLLNKAQIYKLKAETYFKSMPLK